MIRLELSTRTLQQNIQAVEERIAPSELMLVVKDDAYGHGVRWVIDAVDSKMWIGSFDVPTAFAVRSAGHAGPVFAWAISDNDEIAAALSADVQLGVGTVEYLDRVAQVARSAGVRAQVHLKIDTGLHRSGIRPEDWEHVVSRALTYQQEGDLELVGVWSHLAEASEADDDRSGREFTAAVDQATLLGANIQFRHLTASAASWWRDGLVGNVARVGAFCYGIRSAGGPELAGISPAATLVSAVESVTERDATIRGGAFDGIPSSLVGARVLTPGGFTRITAIQQTTLTVELWPGAQIGDRIEIFGGSKALSATTLAEEIDTVGEEILTRLSRSLPRVVNKS